MHPHGADVDQQRGGGTQGVDELLRGISREADQVHHDVGLELRDAGPEGPRGVLGGPGWDVINPLGNLDLRVWTWLATGQTIPIPDLGLGVLNHVHADDVAQVIERAIDTPEAVGESFHAVAAQAMTLRGLCCEVAGWFGREPQFEFVGWEEFADRVGQEHADVTRDHVGRSVAGSIEKARRILDHDPGHTTEATLHEALEWLVAAGRVDIGDSSLGAIS